MDAYISNYFWQQNQILRLAWVTKSLNANNLAARWYYRENRPKPVNLILNLGILNWDYFPKGQKTFASRKFASRVFFYPGLFICFLIFYILTLLQPQRESDLCILGLLHPDPFAPRSFCIPGTFASQGLLHPGDYWGGFEFKGGSTPHPPGPKRGGEFGILDLQKVTIKHI